MDGRAITESLSFIPQAVLTSLLALLIGVVYRALKHIALTSYNEMVEHNSDIKKELESIKGGLEDVDVKVMQMQTLLGTFVSTELHHTDTKSISKDISEIKERIARIEGRRNS